MIYMIEKFTGHDTFIVPITIRIKHRFLLVDSFKSMNRDMPFFRGGGGGGLVDLIY
jgi:hypothetical protein